VEDLIDGIKSTELPLAFATLLEAARENGLYDLEHKVQEIQGWEKEQRERQARQMVEEVRPVTEVSSTFRAC